MQRRRKVDHAIYECMSETIERAIRNVEIRLVMSTMAYEQKRGEKKMTGEIQGKANAPKWSNLQKDQMIQAHSELSKEVELRAPDTQSKITHHGVTFVDDRTGHVTGNLEEESTTKDLSDCVKSAQKSAQVWYNLTRLNGGRVALHKTN